MPDKFTCRRSINLYKFEKVIARMHIVTSFFAAGVRTDSEFEFERENVKVVEGVIF